jgi:hypothetical protein
MSRLGEFESSPLLSRFTSNKEGRYTPTGPYLSGAIEMRLGKDRKGQCLNAELRVANGMLEHPLLGTVATNLINEFFSLGLEERPPVTTSKKWLSDEAETRLKCQGATVVRRRQDGNLCLSIQATRGFLSGWFGR